MLKHTFFLFLMGMFLFQAASGQDQVDVKTVKVLPLEGAIGPIAVKLIEKGIGLARDGGAEALIIELNTPGGLTESTWKITKAILNSDIPVVVYIYPSGARAGSAGVFITYSAHIAAMAPATSIGSAAVVAMGGEMDSTMMKKVTNDAVANMQAIARKRGRNEAWIERAIRQAVSISDFAAVDSNVVDLIATNLDDLLTKVDGRTVELPLGPRALATKGARVEMISRSFSEKVLEIISNPNIAFLLLSVGGLGIILELYNPGAILPGVVGGICLVLAFFSFQTLPINYAGLLLILFAIILFLLELKVTSYGILTIGGIISLTLGGLMLIDSAEPYMRVSKGVIAGVVIATTAFFVLALRYVVKVHKKQVTTGSEGLVGQIGYVTEMVAPEGMVHVAGELWRARAAEPLEKGAKIKVIKAEDMLLHVEKFREKTEG